MYQHRKKRFKYWWLVITVIIIGIIVLFSYTLKTDRKTNTVESIIKDGISIIQKVVTFPFQSIGNFFSDIKELNHAREENEKLKQKIESYDRLEAEKQELEKQLQALKEELNIDQVLSEYDYINTTVLSRNVGYWYNTITIDKGKNKNIEIGMAVINNTGLIGKVVNVTNLTATVKLITNSDLNNKISVAVNHENHDLYGLISSYDAENKLLRVEGISNNDVVKEGDYVYTSGLGGTFPSGILIGKVYNITIDEYGLSKIIEVEPSADFDDLNYVSVLKKKEIEEGKE